MKRIEFSFVADELDAHTAEARPKVIYLSGQGSARIEQFADATSDTKNLIIVREPDIWLVDGPRKTVGHSVNHGPDLTVHNPILGPNDGPEELLPLEWGHEQEFFESSKAMPSETINGRLCDVKRVQVDNYDLRLYTDPAQKVPIELRAFKDGEPLFIARYSSYLSNLPYDASMFKPPEGFTKVEPDLAK